jgi:hypothetical protein
VKNIWTVDTIGYTIRLSNTHRRQQPEFGNDFEPWDTALHFAIQFISGPINRKEIAGGSPGTTSTFKLDGILHLIPDSGEIALWVETCTFQVIGKKAFSACNGVSTGR